MAVAHGHGEVLEMTPLQVKQFIAFSGKAGKERVGVMVKKFLGMRNIPKPDDAADALAIAVCAAFNRNKIRL